MDLPLQPETPALEVKDLWKIYDNDLFKPKRYALRGASYQIPAHQCTGLLGHNGAGKTTTIKILFGLIKPTKGKILVQGTKLSKKNLHNFGYMPEINKLPLALNPDEILRFHQKYIGMKKSTQSVAKALEEIEMLPHRSLKLGQMSKGMQRRVAWAVATIHDPDILVLDEPFSGLDPYGKGQMQELISGFLGRNKTVILCTHDIWAIQNLCQNMIVLREGQVAYNSMTPTRESLREAAGFELVLTGVEKGVIQSLVAKAEIDTTQIQSRSGFAHALTVPDYNAAQTILRLALDQGILVREFRSLEAGPHFDQHQIIKMFKRGS